MQKNQPRVAHHGTRGAVVLYLGEVVARRGHDRENLGLVILGGLWASVLIGNLCRRANLCLCLCPCLAHDFAHRGSDHDSQYLFPYHDLCCRLWLARVGHDHDLCL